MQNSIESKFDTKIKDIKDELKTKTDAIQNKQIQLESMLVEILNAIKK